MRPVTGKYIAYDKDAAASATSPTAGEENTGNGTCSIVDVQDDYTLTENWTLTCITEAENGGTFSVVGSVSGNVGNAAVSSEFKFPNTAAYKIKFTISAGDTDFTVGDTFTFSTANAGARTAKGILTEKADASAGDKISSFYARGNFIESKLTGLDPDAKTHLNGRSVGDCFLM
jgi:hypothetical protein